MEDTRPKVATLTTLTASLTFENLPDDKKEEAFLHWLSTQSPEKKVAFLDRARNLVNNGVTENPGLYHYIVIHSTLTEFFLNQRCIDMLNERLEDLIGEDQAMVAFVSYATTTVAAPYPEIHEITEALNTQQPKFSYGICFKVAPIGVTEDEHEPMFFQFLDEFIDGIVDSILSLTTPEDAHRLIQAFKPIRKPENRVSWDFDVTVNEKKRRFLYLVQK